MCVYLHRKAKQMRSKFSNNNKNNNYDTQNFNHRFLIQIGRLRTLQGNIHIACNK